MIKQREANSWKSVSYAKSISGTQTYTKFPIVLRATEQSIPTWSVKGNMSQSGTPTPTSPIYPSECGERTSNLANENNLDLQKWISSSGTISDNPNGTIFKEKIVITTTNYTVKATANQSDVAGIGVAIYNNNDEFIRREYTASLDKTLTFATTTGDNYFKVIVSTRDTPTESLIKSISVMANEGSTAKPFEPYGYKLPIVSGGVTTNVYLSEPIRSFLGYTDTIDSNGTVTRRIKKKVFTGEEPVNGVRLTFDGNNYCASYRFDAIGMEDIIDYEEKMTDISYPKYVSTHLVNKDDTYQLYYTIFDGQMGANDRGSTGNARNRYIIVCVAGLTTAADYQAWFAQQYANGTPVEVYYILETPTTESTTTSAIPTTSGLNTIDVNTTLKPSEMSLTYDGYKLCKGQRYTLLLHDNPLCGISTYKDTLNLATGACTRQIKKIVFNGEENWVDGNFPLTNTYLYFLTLTDMINVGNVAALDIVCSHFPVGNYYVGQDAPGIQHTLIELYFRTTETTLASFKQWLADQYANGTPVTLYHILATPTTETITVPSGLSGTEEGYLTQSETPTPTNPVYPTVNDVPVWE